MEHAEVLVEQKPQLEAALLTNMDSQKRFLAVEADKSWLTILISGSNPEKSLKSRKTKRQLLTLKKDTKMATAANVMELIRKKKQELAAASGNREKPAKFKDGANRIRLLPSWRGEGDGTFWHEFGAHYIKGLDGKLKAVYVCVDKTYGKPCPVCQGIEQAIQTTNNGDEALAALADAKASGRILVNALVGGGDTPDKPVIFELPNSVFGMICELMEEWGDVTNLEEGREIIVSRSGTGLGTKYTVTPAGKVNVVPATVMRQLKNLDEYVKQESEEQMRRALGAISITAGLLAAPTGSDVPRTGAPALKTVNLDEEIIDLDDAALVEIESTASAVKDAPFVPDEPAKVAESAAATDADLESLLADLGVE